MIEALSGCGNYKELQCAMGRAQSWTQTQSNCVSLHGLNHFVTCLTHKTFSFDTPSILVPFFSRWAWCAIMHFAKSVIQPDLVSKTHTSALI